MEFHRHLVSSPLLSCIACCGGLRMGPLDCLLRCVVGGRAERMWVSAIVFYLFSAGRVRGFSIGCIIVS